MVWVTVGFVARGVDAGDEAAQKWLHRHDAGAYDARVRLDQGPENDSDAIVGPVYVAAGGGEFCEPYDGDNADTSRSLVCGVLNLSAKKNRRPYKKPKENNVKSISFWFLGAALMPQITGSGSRYIRKSVAICTPTIM